MTVSELLDITSVQDGNRIVLYEPKENVCDAEYWIPVTSIGHKYNLSDYKQYLHREIFSVEIVGKTVRISMFQE